MTLVVGSTCSYCNGRANNQSAVPLLLQEDQQTRAPFVKIHVAHQIKTWIIWRNVIYFWKNLFQILSSPESNKWDLYWSNCSNNMSLLCVIVPFARKLRFLSWVSPKWCKADPLQNIFFFFNYRNLLFVVYIKKDVSAVFSS